MIKLGNRLLHRRAKRKKGSYIYHQGDINKILFYHKKISPIISQYIYLRRKGSDYVGRCPFCKELTKNDYHFRVSDRKGLYKCFECGAGGTGVISFLMRYFDESFDRVLSFVNINYGPNIHLKPKKIRSPKSRANKDDDLPF